MLHDFIDDGFAAFIHGDDFVDGDVAAHGDVDDVVAGVEQEIDGGIFIQHVLVDGDLCALGWVLTLIVPMPCESFPPKDFIFILPTVLNAVYIAQCEQCGREVGGLTESKLRVGGFRR